MTSPRLVLVPALLPALLISLALTACSSSGSGDGTDSDEGALRGDDATIVCTPVGDPCVVTGPGPVGTTCFRQWKIERQSPTRARVLETADHGNDIAIAATWENSRSYSASSRRLEISWGMFQPYSRIEVSKRRDAFEGEARLFGRHTFSVRCAARSSSPASSRRAVGESCRHPTNDPSARCADGLECDTNGQDHIEADGTCREVSGRRLGESCRHPTNDPSARCADGLECDTNGQDHIDADGTCRRPNQ